MTERQTSRIVDPFEAWLATGLAVEPDAAVSERIDRRVRAAIAAPIPFARRRPRIGRRWKGLLLVAATVAIMGAAASTLGLFSWLVPAEAGWQVAWDRGTQLGLTTVTPDAEVTLERAYGDANQVVVFLVAKGTDGTTKFFADDVTLADADGRSYAPQMEVGDPTAGLVAHVVGFATSEPWLAGERSYTLTVGKLTVSAVGQQQTVTGPWTLQFSIGTAGGWVGTPGSAVALEDATVELTSVVVSPTMIRGEVLVTDATTLPRDFAPIATVEVGGRRIEIRYSSGPDATRGLGLSWFATLEGVDAAVGSGTVEVTELVVFDPEPNVPQVRLQGPWRLDFDLR